MASTAADFATVPCRLRRCAAPSVLRNQSAFFRSDCRKAERLRLSRSAAVRAVAAIDGGVDRCSRDDVGVADKIDSWILSSVPEIVKHVGEAPLLVQLFAHGSDGVKIQQEAASPEVWPEIRKGWDELGRPRPDGIILVEKLLTEEERGCQGGGGPESRSSAPASSESRMWGLVVQGRGMDCAACYVLDTCRVRSSLGFCTHFCLMRSRCFGEPPESQLRSAWLQRR